MIFFLCQDDIHHENQFKWISIGAKYKDRYLEVFVRRCYQFAHIRKFLTSAFKCPIRVSTIYLGYLTNQPLCGPEGGGGRGVGRGLWGLSVEHSRDLHGGRQRLMGEAHFSAR